MNTEMYDWATSDTTVIVYSVTATTYGTDDPDVIDDVYYFPFTDAESQIKAEIAAEEMCKEHNDALR